MLFTIGRTEYTMGFRNKTQGPDFFEDFTSQARQLVQAVEFLTHIYAASPRSASPCAISSTRLSTAVTS